MSNVGDDEDLGGGSVLTGKKRKAGTRGPFRENGSVAKRVLRSGSKLRADAETTFAMDLEVSKSDSLERKQCEAIVEADGSRVLTVDISNGEEDRELVNMNVSDVSEESARCSDNNVEVSGVAVTEFAQANGVCTQGS